MQNFALPKIDLPAGKNAIKKEKKQRALLNSAYGLFTTIGYEDTTIMQIALKAGVGKGTFYNYFRDKEDIRDTLIVEKSSDVLSMAVEHLSADPNVDSMSFTDKIIFVVDDIITYLSRDLALMKFVSKSLSWGVLRNSKARSPERQSLKDFVVEQLDRDHVKLKNPDLLIFTVIELINSTCYSVILYGEPLTFSDYKPYLYHELRLLVDDAILQENPKLN